GAAIIFLAVYAAVKLVQTERESNNLESAKQLEVILTPVETGFEEGKAVPPIVFPTESRIYNNCTNEGNFGEQLIAVVSSSGIGQKWPAPGNPLISYNKYIFSEPIIQGKEINVFPKPFEIPFKVADIIVLWADKYCFVNAPNEIRDEVMSLNLRNINTTDSLTLCAKNSKKVCFYSRLDGCDIVVNPEQKTVEKNGKIVYYYGALVYGAIFSDPLLYECQVKRLMKRASEMSMLYFAKSQIIATESPSGCSANLQPELTIYANKAARFNKSDELGGVVFEADELRRMNEQMSCGKLWGER
ncbi:MAG: hypothetical protein V1839_00785, partial [archaeon]